MLVHAAMAVNARNPRLLYVGYRTEQFQPEAMAYIHMRLGRYTVPRLIDTSATCPTSPTMPR